MTDRKVVSMFFRGKYVFLSNFYWSPFVFDGQVYSTAEAAFQAQKCADPDDMDAFVALDSGRAAKALGRKVRMRDDWDDIKVDVMRRVIDAKFSNERLATKLLAVEGEIVEDNTWHDTFWGRCNGQGENWLGRILMDKREELRRQSAVAPISSS